MTSPTSQRGAIVKSNKERITIHLDPDIIEWLRGRVRGGGNYQTPINETLREAVIQRVVAMEVDAQARGQSIPPRTDLRMVLDGLEARLELPDQLRCRHAVIGGDEAPDLDQVLLGALGQSELAARRCNRSSPRRMIRSASKSRTRPASMSPRPS